VKSLFPGFSSMNVGAVSQMQSVCQFHGSLSPVVGT
jgi:hypothetical protein